MAVSTMAEASPVKPMSRWLATSAGTDAPRTQTTVSDLKPGSVWRYTVPAPRYAAAVTNSHLDAAMAEIAPDQRERWTDWVRGQLGNVYDVRGIAVRSPSILERVAQRMPGGPREVTTVMDVDRAYPDEFYQPSTRVPVEQFDGRWYLAAPLLAEP